MNKVIRYIVAGACVALTVMPLQAAELWVGAATMDITPQEPVALSGQLHVRIAKQALTPISVTSLVIESRENERTQDYAIMVSCDVVAIRSGISQKVREKIGQVLPEIDATKIVLNATHTHTAPVTLEESYQKMQLEAMSPQAYTEFFVGQIVKAIQSSWEQRQKASFGYGQGHALLAQNRRAVYADGTAVMYGDTTKDSFRSIEGYEDHHVDCLFFWNKQQELIATVINVACPAQEVEGLSQIHADFWAPVRETLKERHGKQLHVLGWIGAAGDQSPRPIYGKAADARMRRLSGLNRLQELARRLVNSWEDVYNIAKVETYDDVLLKHQVREIPLPWRRVSSEELETAKKAVAELKDQPGKELLLGWNQRVIDRFEKDRNDDTAYVMQLNAIRLGDVAIASNPFELFTDFGVQMKAKSPAIQSFIIQLAGDSGGYVPTERAVQGGGYSAVVQSSRVGPEGGQVLVDETLKAWKLLWQDTKP